MTSFDTRKFSDLRRLQRFLGSIRSDHVSSLKYYFDAETASFRRKCVREDPNASVNGEKHNLGTPLKSVASTGTCIVSLGESGKWQKLASKLEDKKLCDRAQKGLKSSASKFCKDLGKEGSNTEAYKYYCLAWLTEAYSHISDGKSIGVKILKKLKSAISNGSLGDESHLDSAYLIHLIFRALKSCSELDDQIKKEVRKRAFREVERQISLLVAGSKNADLFQLAYSIVLTADCGRNLRPDETLVLRAGLDRLFDEQLNDGTWVRSSPQFQHDGDGAVFCYEYEMLAQLMKCQLLRDHLIRHHLEPLARAAFALRDTAAVLEDDSEGGLRPVGQGWSSGHRPQHEGPESWSTASVFLFAHLLDRLLAEAIRKSVFQQIDVDYPTSPKSASVFAPDFLDSELFVPGIEAPYCTKKVILERFVERVSLGKSQIENGLQLENGTPVSAIFYGPPGTSKTRLAKYIADYLGWPLLTVNPSYFSRNGFDKIQAQADRLFDMLAASERIVAFLDELDEMVRDRTNSELLSRFLTTAMLPKLAKINEARRIVFLVATNYIENFDPAVSRSGRFDMIIQIMPPSAEAKLKSWDRVGEKLESFDGCKKEALRQIGCLTYAEFDAVSTKLEDAKNYDQFLNRLREAECTLKNKIPSQEVTWEEACITQRDRIRIPPLIPNGIEPQSDAKQETDRAGADGVNGPGSETPLDSSITAVTPHVPVKEHTNGERGVGG